VFHGNNTGNGNRTCTEYGKLDFAKVKKTYFSDYLRFADNFTYLNVSSGRFDRENYTLYINKNGVEYYVDKEKHVIGMVEGKNVTHFYYSSRASMSGFALSSKFEGCNSTEIYRSPKDEWVLCAASISRVSAVALLAAVASAVLSLF